MDQGCKRAILRWHRRAGKDKASICYMFAQMLQRTGAYYYFFPTYAQGRKAVWEMTDNDGFKLLDHMPRELIKGGKINTNEMKFETINGSVFRLIGSDDIDKIVGTNPVGCVLSKYAIKEKKAWTYIRPILTVNKGWAIFNSTPRGRNHMYELENMVKKNPKWFVSELQTVWPDQPNYSGILSPAEIQEERDSGMIEEDINQEYGVSYGKSTGGLYYAAAIEQAREGKRIGEYPPDMDLWVDTYWDLGIEDDTAVWFKQIQWGKHIWIDLREAPGKSIIEWVQVLKDTGYKFRYHYLPHDANKRNMELRSTKDIFDEALANAGVGGSTIIVPKTANIHEAIELVRERFGTFYFHEPNVHGGILKLSNYRRKFNAKTGAYDPAPFRDYTKDCADAFRAVLGEDIGLDENSPYMIPSNQKPQVINEWDLWD